jgi:cytochrome c peroxidase
MKQFNSKMVFLTLVAFVLISGTIDLGNLFNYSNQAIPNYVDLVFFDQVPASNPMNDKLATLGRVLFYDKHLSRWISTVFFY